MSEFRKDLLTPQSPPQLNRALNTDFSSNSNVRIDHFKDNDPFMGLFDAFSKISQGNKGDPATPLEHLTLICATLGLKEIRVTKYNPETLTTVWTGQIELDKQNDQRF